MFELGFSPCHVFLRHGTLFGFHGSFICIVPDEGRLELFPLLSVLRQIEPVSILCLSRPTIYDVFSCSEVCAVQVAAVPSAAELPITVQLLSRTKAE